MERRIGLVQACFDERPSAFASEDEGVLLHLAQIRHRPAVERLVAALYAERRGDHRPRRRGRSRARSGHPETKRA